MLDLHRSLIDFYDVTLPVDEERRGQGEIATPVKQKTVNDVVQASDIFARKHDGKRKPTLLNELAQGYGIRRVIHIQSQQLKALCGPASVLLFECLQISLAIGRRRGPEIEQQRLALKCLECSGFSRQIRQRKIRRCNWDEQQ